MFLLKPNHKFLVDENVRIELYEFLKDNGFDVIHSPKSAPDTLLTSISKTQKRILITNDEDFSEYSEDKVFSVVWLRIAQNDPNTLIYSFGKLLGEIKDLAGKLIILKAKSWEAFPLGEEFVI